jgi:hypothetical protein
MECVHCNGAGCDKCRAGYTQVNQCPMEVFTPEIANFIESVKDADEGILPESGGRNQQTDCWVSARRWFKDEESRLKVRT